MPVYRRLIYRSNEIMHRLMDVRFRNSRKKTIYSPPWLKIAGATAPSPSLVAVGARLRHRGRSKNASFAPGVRPSRMMRSLLLASLTAAARRQRRWARTAAARTRPPKRSSIGSSDEVVSLSLPPSSAMPLLWLLSFSYVPISFEDDGDALL